MQQRAPLQSQAVAAGCRYPAADYARLRSRPTRGATVPPAMSRPLALITAAALAATLALPASAQQLVQRRDLSYALALAIATGAIDACKALGLSATAAVVVD